MITSKVNESFYRVKGELHELQPIMNRLHVERPGAYFDPMVKRGLKPPYDKFYNVVDGDLIIPSGLIEFLGEYGVQHVQKTPEYTPEEILEFIKSRDLPFEPYDYQVKAVIECILKYQQIALAATASGKSVILSLIADFFRSKGKKGLILVPSISLTTQLKGDIQDYNLHDLYNETKLIGGDNTDKILNTQLTISTWQSASKCKEQMKGIDYIIIDEAQGLKGDTQSADIVYKCVNAKYRIGLTGTLPEAPTDKMSIFSCVGVPKRYIRTQGLIERGLATPVHINMLTLRYGDAHYREFRAIKGYAKQLVYIKEHENRNLLISRLSLKTSENGNTVIMCSHVQHMKDIFTTLMNEKYPDVNVENKDITGKKAFEFQDKYGIYFISGSTKSSERIKIIDILKNHGDAILVSNYQLFSTGINAKGISNIFFASPMKSYVTITQSIGRAIRTHVSKNTAQIYDFVDDFSARGGSGTFVKQSEARIQNSYEPEGFPITKRTITI